MFLWFTALVAYVILVLIAALPPLAIHNEFGSLVGSAPNGSVGASSAPAPDTDGRDAHGRTAIDDPTTPAEQRFIYFLLVIPIAAALNGVVLYFLSYRHLRLLYYRFEREAIAAHALLERFEELRVTLMPLNESLATANNSSIALTSQLPLRSFARPSVKRPPMLKHIKSKARPPRAVFATHDTPLCSEVRFVVDCGWSVLEKLSAERAELAAVVARMEARLGEIGSAPINPSATSVWLGNVADRSFLAPSGGSFINPVRSHRSRGPLTPVTAVDSVPRTTNSSFAVAPAASSGRSWYPIGMGSVEAADAAMPFGASLEDEPGATAPAPSTEPRATRRRMRQTVVRVEEADATAEASAEGTPLRPQAAVVNAEQAATAPF